MSRISPQERFELQFERRGENDCWSWRNCKSALGYGRFYLDGKSRIASRVAFEFANGSIPENLCVLHSCDNPSCVNPNHLRLGTFADNTADILKRGRWQKPRKMAPEIAATIRSRLAENKKLHREIASEVGMCRQYVSFLAKKYKMEARDE